jgi:hypothetical protein
MLNKQFCYGCNRHRGHEGGKYIIANDKQVKFRCKECLSKVKKPRKVK